MRWPGSSTVPSLSGRQLLPSSPDIQPSNQSILHPPSVAVQHMHVRSSIFTQKSHTSNLYISTH